MKMTTFVSNMMTFVLFQISLGAHAAACTAFAQGAGGVIGAAAEVASSWLGGWGSTLLGAAAPLPGEAGAPSADADEAPLGALAVVACSNGSVLVGLSGSGLRFWDLDAERPFPVRFSTIVMISY